MKNDTCCFTGHRKIPKEEYPRIQKSLAREVEALIAQGVVHFLAGGALGFDTLAALVVLYLREKHPQIQLHLILPCKNQTRGWSAEDAALYRSILFKADKILYCSEFYHTGCMHKRNRYLVDTSKFCICHCTKQTGGTAYTVNYAISQELTLIWI